METKHTPGPWKAYGSETILCRVKSPAGLICDMYPDEHAWSNVRLIAAAPELLELVQQMESLWMDYMHNVPEFAKQGDIWAKQAGKALAKATGKPLVAP